MNKQRRAEIAKTVAKVNAIKEKAEAFKEGILGLIEDAKSEVESLKDEEQEAFDGMPESLQQGDKGQAAEAAVSNLESGNEKLQEIMESLENLESEFQEAIDSLESAQNGG